MHLEKNVFENIINTVIEVKGKAKDNIKARIDITLFCHRKNMKLVYVRSWVVKPKVSFALDKNAYLLVYQWLKSLCFFDRYVLNISRLVNSEDCKLYGIKNHDCHMFTHSISLSRFISKWDIRCTHGDQLFI
jgi:hypothetical protein